jgi:hypothetical protein
VTDLPPEYLDSKTPPDVVVTDTAAPAITDPTLGFALGTPIDVPVVPATPAHRLVTIGDSLTHGVSSGAVFHTDLSWPALVATALGIKAFRVPTYKGPLDGLPVNIESLVRQLQKKFGVDVSLFEKVQLPIALHSILDKNEDYWERGDGSKPPRTDIRYENLGIYGWDIRDSLSFTAGLAATRATAKSEDTLLGLKPEHDNDIAANSVLAPFGVSATQVEAAAMHGRDGGIDTLVVALGANNSLGSVVDKSVRWSSVGYADLDLKGSYNVWRPTHFALEYGALITAIRPIAARRVILATVPHVTIVPAAKGVNPQNPGQKWREGSRYFPYYTDPWIAEKDFRPSKHRHITHQEARAVDSAIDQYNATICEVVRHARGEGREWFILDLCGMLDGIAYRRYLKDAAAAAHNDWTEFELPAPIKDLDSRFYLSDKTKRRQGGIFGLDGIHPTTSAYGVIAQRVLDILTSAGVPTTSIDFAALLQKDTLNSQPPALVASLLATFAPLATRFITRT